MNVIMRTDSEYTSPIVVVKTKDSSDRVSVDYRRLLHKIGRAKYCTQTYNKEGSAILSRIDGYYRNYVPNYSTVATPLTNLTKKGRPNKVLWSAIEEDSSHQLKKALSMKPVLQPSDYTK